VWGGSVAATSDDEEAESIDGAGDDGDF
jgi:hypothetical protein